MVPALYLRDLLPGSEPRARQEEVCPRGDEQEGDTTVCMLGRLQHLCSSYLDLVP